MKYLEVKIVVAADKIVFKIENTAINSSNMIADVYDLNKLHMEIRVSRIFQKVMNIRSTIVKSPIEIFDKDDFATLGDMLCKLLLEQKDLRETFAINTKYVNDSTDIRCRIFLEFDKNVHEMAELPWEYIRFEKQYLAATARSGFDVIRKINLSDELSNRELPVAGRLNVVLIIADPETPDRALPNSEKEYLRDMFSALKKIAPDKFNYSIVSSPSRKNLVDKVREATGKLQLNNEPYLIHFYGHAKPDGVALSPGTDNAAQADWINDDYFAELFDEMSKNELPAGFIFTACDSGKITQFAENRGVALHMLAHHQLHAVVAMQNEVISNVAIEFMRVVYQSLLDGAELAEAISKGRTYLGIKHNYGASSGDRGSYSNNAFGSPVIFSSTYKPIRFVYPVEKEATSPGSIMAPPQTTTTTQASAAATSASQWSNSPVNPQSGGL